MAAKALPKMFGLDLSILQSNSRSYFGPEDTKILEDFCASNETFQDFLAADNRPTLSNLRTYDWGLPELYKMLGHDYDTLTGVVNHEGQAILPILNEKVRSKIVRICSSSSRAESGIGRSFRRQRSETPGSIKSFRDASRERSETPGMVINNYRSLVLGNEPTPSTKYLTPTVEAEEDVRKQNYLSTTRRASSVAANPSSAKSYTNKAYRVNTAGTEAKPQGENLMATQEQLMAAIARKRTISLKRRSIEKKKDAFEASESSDEQDEEDI
ncbi:uncharacterized protein L3040_008815 [Drepanopeziza brunnea f. sp. 'multigermtubi']|uniref:Uncharacterized protein n=1 Tax=Marssonina brunnea f. sp. multigermtubi (strain MB_m1) TaxID=1072389 RepID=K1WYI5_MARBU|nr:uncharacterized protein MBM_08376 [Drepanopeziza brunnea f. sp. 'multigermtubi' MB_m1]EKD13658.1 hypothetical protein MBM_08376 [Drepanopeziza brunnea f. sp. 'multigermtubi' MB_m1]KAJ5033158.1 hypothetical protein L3040_008815 [Drepanopeziza brunnea f. sp. 'multigermtubi']